MQRFRGISVSVYGRIFLRGYREIPRRVSPWVPLEWCSVTLSSKDNSSISPRNYTNVSEDIFPRDSFRILEGTLDEIPENIGKNP